MTGESEPTPSLRLRGPEVLGDPLVVELLGERLIAVIATLEADGGVHAVPLWFAVVEDGILLATGSASRKVRNLERDPRATLVLHDSRPGFEVCGASIRGRVTIVRGADATSLVATVHRRYVDRAALARPEIARFLAGDDAALLFAPESATTWDERDNPATAALRSSGEALPLVPTTSRPADPE